MGKIHNICLNCNQEYYGQGKKFCSRKCQGEYATGRKMNFTEEHRKFLSEKMSKMTKGKSLSETQKKKISESSKKIWDDPDYRKKMRNMRLGHKVSQETRDKISKSQTGRKNPWVSEYNRKRTPPSGPKHSDEFKKRMSERVSGSGNPMFGSPPAIINPVKFINKNGEEYTFRSSWEAKFAKYLDENNIVWEYEKTTYPLSNGESYTPDFFTENAIYEVKGYFRGHSKNKWELFLREYPEEKIILADRKYLMEILKIKL